MTPPVFITGTRRSGTTLLFQALSGSSKLWCRNELHEIHSLLFDEVEAVSKLDHRLDQAGLALPAEPASADGKPTERFSGRMGETAHRAGKVRWCLKDPEVSGYLDQYASSYPNAQFVIIVRDPWAVARSFLERGTSCSWFSAGERWGKEVAQQLHFQRDHRDRTLLIKYEDLVERFPHELQRVCEFLAIPMEESLKRYYERDSGIVIHEGNQNVMRPPDASINEKWRRSLNQRQLACVETAAGEVMRSVGYEPESQAGPPLREPRKHCTVCIIGSCGSTGGSVPRSGTVSASGCHGCLAQPPLGT